MAVLHGYGPILHPIVQQQSGEALYSFDSLLPVSALLIGRHFRCARERTPNSKVFQIQFTNTLCSFLNSARTPNQNHHFIKVLFSPSKKQSIQLNLNPTSEGTAK